MNIYCVPVLENRTWKIQYLLEYIIKIKCISNASYYTIQRTILFNSLFQHNFHFKIASIVSFARYGLWNTPNQDVLQGFNATAPPLAFENSVNFPYQIAAIISTQCHEFPRLVMLNEESGIREEDAYLRQYHILISIWKYERTG